MPRSRRGHKLDLRARHKRGAYYRGAGPRRDCLKTSQMVGTDAFHRVPNFRVGEEHPGTRWNASLTVLRAVPLRKSGNRNFLTEGDVLDCVQQGDSLFKRSLKSLAAGNEPHSSCALVDDGSSDRVLKVGSAFGFTATINEPGTTHVTIGDLVPAEVDGMIAGQFGIDAFVELAVTGTARVQGFEAAIIFRKFLFDDVRLNRDAEVIGLTGEVGGNMIILILLESVVSQVAPQHGGHAQVMRFGKTTRDLHDLSSAFLRSEVDRRPNRCGSHVVSLFNRSEHNLVEFVREGQQLVVVEFHEERNLMRILSGHCAQDSESGGDGIAAAFNGEAHDVFGIEIIRVFGETGSRRVF